MIVLSLSAISNGMAVHLSPAVRFALDMRSNQNLASFPPGRFIASSNQSSIWRGTGFVCWRDSDQIRSATLCAAGINSPGKVSFSRVEPRSRRSIVVSKNALGAVTDAANCRNVAQTSAESLALQRPATADDHKSSSVIPDKTSCFKKLIAQSGVCVAAAEIELQYRDRLPSK